MTVPFDYFDDGTPFVLALIGDMWSEAQLLSYASVLERAGEGRIAPTLAEAPGG